ncbi:MAG: GHKL domain-containing protein, partial [Verrucomicrobia bacterium]|nr:GHKL domain-containing protein [Verrucomicrobiota bacterium]
METLLIILLAVIAAFAIRRSRRLSQDVEEIASTLRSDTSLLGEMDTMSQDASLTSLKHSLTNFLTEIDLSRKSERRQRRFFEGMLNQIEDALFILDDNLEIRFANDAARRLFPSEQDHQGRQLIEVCLDHRISDAATLALETQTKTREELRRAVPGSSSERNEHNYLVEAEPLVQKNGFGSGAWILIRDTTRQAETEQIRRDFVANASHELRTPLSIISGYLEMLDEDNNLKLNEESTQRSIQTMRNNCDRITRIVEDMLTISKLESSADLLKIEHFDIADSIRNSVEQLQSICDSQKASIKVKIPEENHFIEGDHFYWDQIFFNLIENALKQNPKPNLKITVRVTRHGDQLIINISDNGIGIPTEDLPNIFQRFYRVEKHHAQTIKGTGLGLSIVKRAIEAHHGTITATSDPGIKTTFTITLPQGSRMTNHPVPKKNEGSGGECG